jgi:serine/threonine protein phosphatase PrpC
MSNRLATRIGMPAPEDRVSGALDVVRFQEPTIGALARTKGSLFLLAQVTGSAAALPRAARETLEQVERDYYYDLSAGVLGSLGKALANANRRLYHQRARLGIPAQAGVSLIAMAIRGREGHVAKLGPAAAVLLRGGRMYELPPPPAVREEDPRVRERRVAATLGEALEIQPYTWQGELAPDDRLALVSRNLAHVVGVDELKRALSTLRPAAAVEHLEHLFQIRGGRGSDGILAIEIAALPATATTHQLEPVRAAEPLAGVPDQSPVPLADAIGRFFHRTGEAIDAGQRALGRGVLYAFNVLFAFVPRRRPEYPRQILRTAAVEEGRRRRLGVVGMVAVAAMLAAGSTVASLPSPRPTEAIPRAEVARAAIVEAQDLVSQVEARVDGVDLVDRAPDAAKGLLNSAFAALQRAAGAGVVAADLESLQSRVDGGLDAIYVVARIHEASIVTDLSGSFSDLKPLDMAVAPDGSLWVAETGRGRVIRVDPLSGEVRVVYRAGQALGDRTAGAPWLIATAATDVVLIDRQRQAWRFDLAEQEPRRLGLPGLDAVGSNSHLLAALQHRPPLEIFNLYLVDATSGAVHKWSPADVVPVVYTKGPEPFLVGEPDLPAAGARDLFVDANLWLLQARTVTRVNFGTPQPQADYSLDPPPDVEVRPNLDYRLLDGATVGDRELFYVYDAANARIIAFQRADGAFVRQWLAPRQGRAAGVLDQVVAMSVASVADGPPVAVLLTRGSVVRVVLE